VPRDGKGQKKGNTFKGEGKGDRRIGIGDNEREGFVRRVETEKSGIDCSRI